MTGERELQGRDVLEDQVAWLADTVNTSKTAVAQLMRVAWRTVGGICERVAAQAQREVDLLAGLTRIGIDEPRVTDPPSRIPARRNAGSRGRKVLAPVPLGRRWCLVGVGPEPDRDTQGDDQLALEEIRRLFDRYRRIARHGMVTEREEIEEIEEAEEPPALTVR